MIEHQIEEKGVVEFFYIDSTFPSGRVSSGIPHLEKVLQTKFPNCYIQLRSRDEEIREEIAEHVMGKTVKDIISLMRHEVTIQGYYMRYYHLRFTPVEGHWILT